MSLPRTGPFCSMRPIRSIIRQLGWLGLTMFCLAGIAMSAEEAIYDEAKVPPYELPDVLRMVNGQSVTKAEQWPARRAELMELFATQVYGRTPTEKLPVTYRVLSEKTDALGGAATRREVEFKFQRGDKTLTAVCLLYLPNRATGPVPVVVGLNFYGNHTTTHEPDVLITSSWVANDEKAGITDHRATDRNRGIQAGQWPFAQVIDRGIAVATMYYGDIDPDFDDNFQNGIHALFNPSGDPVAKDAWGSIGAWAWGLSRIADYLIAEVPQIDPQRMAVMGHSRLGKTALWAGAQDPRFTVVISNNSGCGGAALSKRIFGESVGRINRSFPHWFCDNFQQYNDHEERLPVDQHELLALIAPRAVLVASAEDDRWADPRGELLGAYHASPAFKLLGKTGLDSDQLPPLNKLLDTTVGYRIRPGAHDVLPEDWQAYCDFAEANGWGRP
ncbi:MAG: acetylxylan esterase [Pirellulales bacterium]